MTKSSDLFITPIGLRLVSNPSRPNLPDPITKPYEGAITAKIESASYSISSNRLMGVITGSADRRYKDGQFIVTSPVSEMLGRDLYRVVDGSVYIVNWVDEDIRMDERLIEGGREVRPRAGDETLWHFVWRDKTETKPYEEDVWKWTANGPSEYWKRIDNGYIRPGQAYVEGWRYGGQAVW